MTTQLMARRFAAAALLRCPATSARRATLRHNSAAPLTAAPVRAMATGGRDDDDKSWSEIASQAAGALKSAAKKVGKGVQKALGQDEATKLERQQKKAREELERPPDCTQTPFRSSCAYCNSFSPPDAGEVMPVGEGDD